jgi:hypothetical protein
MRMTTAEKQESALMEISLEVLNSNTSSNKNEKTFNPLS